MYVGSYVNVRICMRYSEKAYEANEAYVELSVPNGYISESNDIFGFLGGSGTYKVAKEIGRKDCYVKRWNCFVWNKSTNELY